jgi:hypothetical protein
MKHLKLLLVIIGVMLFANEPVAAGEYDLHQAVLDKNVQLVIRLLSKGAAINNIGSRKYGYGSALHLAVREGHVEIAQVLIDRGAQVDVLDPDDFTPLHNAAWNGNLEMTELLLEAGADIEASTYDGDTPLSLAQNNDQAQVAEFIQAKLMASTVVDTKVESTTTSDSGVTDISGTYIADISGSAPLLKALLKNPLQEGTRELELVQNGNQITGTFVDGGGKIYGDIVGNTIRFDWHPISGWHGRGTLIIKPETNEIVGVFESLKTTCVACGYGKLNLTKIESDAAPIPDISGTYISEITRSASGASCGICAGTFMKKKNRKEITLEQTGNAIIGVDGPENPKIIGTREENTISFYILPAGNQIEGTWEINADGTEMVGKWKKTGGGGDSGKWNLKRVQ